MNQARVQVMGVVNVTPDSFSDGGRFLDRTAALAQALTADRRRAPTPRHRRREHPPRGRARLRGRGDRARRPGDRGRSAPRAPIPISIDTMKPAVARAAIAAGRATCGTTSPALRWSADSAGDRRRTGLRGRADAHAGRAAHHAGRARATTTWWRRWRAFLSERARGRDGGWRRARRDLARSRASASARPLAHNLALLRHLDALGGAWAFRSCSGVSRKRFIQALDPRGRIGRRPARRLARGGPGRGGQRRGDGPRSTTCARRCRRSPCGRRFRQSPRRSAARP